jgi:hypothetical protein
MIKMMAKIIALIMAIFGLAKPSAPGSVPESAPESSTEPDTSMNPEALRYWCDYYSDLYGIDNIAVRALCWTESSFGKFLVNKSDPYGGAYGPFQFLLPTARSVFLEIEKVNYTDDELKSILLTDSKRATHAACFYLAKLISNFGSYKSAILAYKGALSDTAKKKVWDIFSQAYTREGGIG